MEGRTITAQKTIGQTPYTTQTAYDPLGHINSITYPQNGGVVNYAYDGAFNIVSVSDPSSGTVYAAFSGYNALGQPGRSVLQTERTRPPPIPIIRSITASRR